MRHILRVSDQKAGECGDPRWLEGHGCDRYARENSGPLSGVLGSLSGRSLRSEDYGHRIRARSGSAKGIQREFTWEARRHTQCAEAKVSRARSACRSARDRIVHRFSSSNPQIRRSPSGHFLHYLKDINGKNCDHPLHCNKMLWRLVTGGHVSQVRASIFRTGDHSSGVGDQRLSACTPSKEVRWDAYIQSQTSSRDHDLSVLQ